MKFIKPFLIPVLTSLPFFYQAMSLFYEINNISIKVVYSIGIICSVIAAFFMIWSKDWFKATCQPFNIKINRFNVETWNLDTVFCFFLYTLNYAILDVEAPFSMYYLFALGTFAAASVRVFRISPV